MSLKGDKYETQEEIRFRLEQTVVLYDGKPVYISRVGLPDAEEGKEIARVFFFDLPIVEGGRAPETRKFLSSKKFDLAPFKMGYMNHNGEAYFIARTPVRQNKQGLSSATTTISDVRGKNAKELLTFNQMLRSKGFVEMVDGIYPDFKQAGVLLEDKNVSSVAISRSFAFVIDHDLEALILLHKGIKCGLAMKNDRALKIPPKFHFLREEMEDHRIPIA